MAWWVLPNPCNQSSYRTFSLLQTRVSQPLHHWHVELGHPLLWVAVLGIVGELTASIVSWKMLEHDKVKCFQTLLNVLSVTESPRWNHCHRMFLSGPFQLTPLPPRGNCFLISISIVLPDHELYINESAQYLLMSMRFILVIVPLDQYPIGCCPFCCWWTFALFPVFGCSE